MSARPATGQRFDLLSSVMRGCSREAQSAGPVLLVFFRGDWCEYCRDQLGELARAARAFQQHGVRIVAVTTDDDDGRRSMLERIGHQFPVLADPNGDLIRRIDLVDPFEFREVPVSLPAIFLLDRDGVVQYHYVGRSPDDRPRTELLLLAAERLSLET